MFFRGKGAVLLNLEGRIAYASTRFCDLVGVDHTKVAGMSFFDFVFPEDVARAKETFELSIEPHASPFRFRLRASNGKEVTADIQSAAARTSGGQAFGVSVMVTTVDS